MDRERSVGGRRGLNAGQSGGRMGGEVLAFDLGGGFFFRRHGRLGFCRMIEM